MIKRTSTSLTAVLAVATVALAFASCGIEAAEQVEAKTPAEQIAERFAEPVVTPEKLAEAQAKIDAARKKSEAARKTADETKRIAAAKRAEEKVAADAAAAATIKAADQAKADEAEMLAQARAEADQRRAEMAAAHDEREKAELAAAGAANKAKAEQELLRLAVERRAQEQAAADAAKSAAEDKLIAEAKAQAAERARIAAEQQAVDAKRDAEARQLAEARAQAAERERLAEAQKQADLKALETRREAEAKLLAEKLRTAEVAREAKIAAAAEAVRQSAPQPVAGLAAPAPADQHMAILILMEPGNKGIRRLDKTADPILCVRDGCYISEGNDQPARLMPRARALGVGNTWGRRAGACQHSLGCTFRDVDVIAGGGMVQPVDMKIMVHDRREVQSITTDSGCLYDGGRLSCRRPIVANGYRMWVVPEALARRAGSTALETALRDGLPQSTSAGLVR